MIGFLDSVVDGQVVGWALNENACEEPVAVTISINGRAVATALAVSHRDDIGLRYGCKGYHGFSVDLRQCVSPTYHALVDVRASDGSVLGNSPLCTSIPEHSISHPRTILFMHIPKTAGTSFKEAIEPSYTLAETLYLYPHDNYYPADIPIWRFPLDHRARLRLIMGHFSFGLHSALPQDCEYITLVRRPFDRLISHYFHLTRHSPEMLKVGNAVKSFREALEDPPGVCFDNLMVRCFSGADPNDYPVGSLDYRLFETAVRNVREHFSYVGLQENSFSAYETLAGRYGWNSGVGLQNVNVTNCVLTEEERTAAQPIVECSQRWDTLLYEEIVRLFGHQVAAVPATA